MESLHNKIQNNTVTQNPKSLSSVPNWEH